MKQMMCLVCVCCLLVPAMAQSSLLGITTDKTTSLVFPFSIQHVDRGSKELLAQQVQEAGNILLIKASERNFPETNLSVVTSDGSVYSFKVCYDSLQAETVHYLPVKKIATIETYANGILDNPKRAKGIEDSKWQVSTQVIGIYVKDNIMFYQIEIHNHSSLDYDIELLRFYIRDKRRGKRTAVQENDLKPLYVAGNILQVKAHSNTTVTVALEKFTIPDEKYLAVQLMEKNGGRHLFMKISNKKIMTAVILPDLK